MKFLIPLLLTISMLASSCSSTYTNWDRSIANEVTPPLNAEELFTIKTTQIPGYNMSNADRVPSIIKSELRINAEYIEDPKMPSDAAFRIVPSIENQQYKIKIYASVAARNDEGAYKELVRFMKNFSGEKFISPYSLYELYYNAKLNDFPTLQVVAKLRGLSSLQIEDTALLDRH